ncbi:MAG: S24/S26 family peptidase [Halobacteriovoraceae bacterium]|nr:S24/S26 family peptidase [Halobacteriovoraceae bacterium]
MKVSGNSMSPYLQDGDEIRYSESLSPTTGNLVLCRQNGETFIHRYLPNKLIKGDNGLYFDWENPRDNQIIAVATHRIVKEQEVEIGRGILQVLLAELSQRNRKGVIPRKVFRLLIILIGTLSRFLRA